MTYPNIEKRKEHRDMLAKRGAGCAKEYLMNDSIEEYIIKRDTEGYYWGHFQIQDPFVRYYWVRNNFRTFLTLTIISVLAILVGAITFDVLFMQGKILCNVPPEYYTEEMKNHRSIIMLAILPEILASIGLFVLTFNWVRKAEKIIEEHAFTLSHRYNLQIKECGSYFD